MTKVLDGYIRVSQVGAREGEGFISPDVQEQAIRRWAQQSGGRYEVVIAEHELNVSGGTMDRPVFNEIMQRIRSGKSDGIVVFKLDRFARSLLGAISTLAEIGEHGAIFASATEPTLDYSTPSGRAFVQQMFVFAEFVRSTSKEAWATAQRHAVERGIHIAPNGYLGYDKVNGRLVPNSDAPAVVEVFRRRGEGESWGSLAEYLNRVAPKPEGIWAGAAVQRLCSKRVYVGEASRYVAQDVDGRGAIVNRDAHPALVTEPEWGAGQMNPRLAVGGRRDGQPLPLLAGLIRCAGCRFALSSARGPKGERLYRCRTLHASGRCASPTSVMADALDEHVQEVVLAHIDGMTRLVPDSGERERLTAELTQARVDREDFRRDREARRKLGAAGWHEFLDEYLRAVGDAEDALGLLDAREGVAVDGLTREHFLSLPVDDRREVLAGFIDTIMVRRSRGRGPNVDPMEIRSRILWRGEAPADLPRPRVTSPVIPFDFGEQHVEAGMVAAQHAA